jgi:hypothetical protein
MSYLDMVAVRTALCTVSNVLDTGPSLRLYVLEYKYRLACVESGMYSVNCERRTLVIQRFNTDWPEQRLSRHVCETSFLFLYNIAYMFISPHVVQTVR